MERVHADITVVLCKKKAKKKLASDRRVFGNVSLAPVDCRRERKRLETIVLKALVLIAPSVSDVA